MSAHARRVKHPTLSFVALAIALASPALAQDTPGWAGEASLNGSATTGNNDTTDVGFALKLKNRGSDWRHNFALSADYGRSQGDTNKRRYRGSYKIGRDLAARVYAFLNTDYYSDDFGAFKNGWYGGGGIGYSALIEGPTLWRIEAGAGYRRQKARLVPMSVNDPVSRIERFGSARLYSDLEHAFNDNVLFANDTELFYGDVDTFFTNESSLTSTLFGSLGVRASFRVETHSDVPEGREKTDTISRIGIVYTME